jgi:hypothetical protein
MVAGVPADEARAGDDVVVHEQDDLAGRFGDTPVKGAQLAALLHKNGSERRKFRLEASEQRMRAVRIPVEHHDDLGRRRIGRGGLDEAAQ